MKKGSWTQILQDRIIKLFSCKCVLFFKNRTDGSEVDSEISRAVSLISKWGHHPGFNRLDSPCPKPWLWDLHMAETWGCGSCPSESRSWEHCPKQIWKVEPLPQWAQKAEHQAKEDYSQALRSNRIYLARFSICLGPITPFFPISPFWNGNVYPVTFSPLYLETHTCLDSQARSWRGILSQDVLYLQSYS